MSRRVIIPPGVSPNPHLSPGVQVDDILYVSGHVGTDGNGNILGGMGAQTRQALANLRAVIVTAGGRMEDIIKMTCYLTNMDDYAEYAKVRMETWRDDPPATSTICVAHLMRPELLVELEAVAYIRKDGED